MTGVEACEKVMEQVNSVVSGKEEIVKKVMTAIISGGHILIEDIPGVGKTTMAKAFAKAMNLDNKRIQFTTDVMPSDITGFMMYDKKENDFVYKPGAAVCNLLLADEINRTSSKTQSALLEVMEEGKLTVDGKSKSVPNPFIVIATQNPIGSVGTSALPESQLDRFMFQISMGYPSDLQEIDMISNRQKTGDLINGIRGIISREDLLVIQGEVQKVFVHRDVIQYVVDIANITRNHEHILLGISPRGTLAIVNAAKGLAYIEGRDYVIPDDIKKIICDAAKHRIVLSPKAKTLGMKVEDIIVDIVRQVPVEKRK